MPWQEDDKRIIVRVSLKKWTEFDNRIHKERSSFQKVGEMLFDEWFRDEQRGTGNPQISAKTSEKSDILPESIYDFAGPEDRWVQALLAVLRGGNELAKKMLQTSVLASLEYVSAVPEAPNEFADIATEAERLAALDRRVDAAKAAAVAGSGTSPVYRGANTSVAKQGAVRPRATRKKMG